MSQDRNTSAAALSASRCHFEGALRGWGVTPIDIDNDGWVDLAAIVETSAGAASARPAQSRRRQF